MADEDHSSHPDQLEEHSLPGTNQAGKEADSSDECDLAVRPGRETSRQQEQLEEHSLPGTNQAGKARDQPD